MALGTAETQIRPYGDSSWRLHDICLLGVEVRGMYKLLFMREVDVESDRRQAQDQISLHLGH